MNQLLCAFSRARPTSWCRHQLPTSSLSTITTRDISDPHIALLFLEATIQWTKATTWWSATLITTTTNLHLDSKLETSSSKPLSFSKCITSLCCSWSPTIASARIVVTDLALDLWRAPVSTLNDLKGLRFPLQGGQTIIPKISKIPSLKKISTILLTRVMITEVPHLKNLKAATVTRERAQRNSSSSITTIRHRTLALTLASPSTQRRPFSKSILRWAFRTKKRRGDSQQ